MQPKKGGSGMVAKFMRLLTSTFGLFIINMTYLLLGAWLFLATSLSTPAMLLVMSWIEAPREESLKNNLEEERDTLVDHIIALGLGPEEYYRGNASAKLAVYELQLANFYRKRATFEITSSNDSLASLKLWSYEGAIIYCYSVITTIGWGNIVPNTINGKLGTVIYGLNGMPLFFSLSSEVSTICSKVTFMVWSSFRRTVLPLIKKKQPGAQNTSGSKSMSRSHRRGRRESSRSQNTASYIRGRREGSRSQYTASDIRGRREGSRSQNTDRSHGVVTTSYSRKAPVAGGRGDWTKATCDVTLSDSTGFCGGESKHHTSQGHADGWRLLRRSRNSVYLKNARSCIDYMLYAHSELRGGRQPEDLPRFRIKTEEDALLLCAQFSRMSTDQLIACMDYVGFDYAQEVLGRAYKPRTVPADVAGARAKTPQTILDSMASRPTFPFEGAARAEFKSNVWLDEGTPSSETTCVINMKSFLHSNSIVEPHGRTAVSRTAMHTQPVPPFCVQLSDSPTDVMHVSESSQIQFHKLGQTELTEYQRPTHPPSQDGSETTPTSATASQPGRATVGNVGHWPGCARRANKPTHAPSNCSVVEDCPYRVDCHTQPPTECTQSLFYACGQHHCTLTAFADASRCRHLDIFNQDKRVKTDLKASHRIDSEVSPGPQIIGQGAPISDPQTPNKGSFGVAVSGSLCSGHVTERESQTQPASEMGRDGSLRVSTRTEATSRLIDAAAADSIVSILTQPQLRRLHGDLNSPKWRELLETRDARYGMIDRFVSVVEAARDQTGQFSMAGHKGQQASLSSSNSRRAAWGPSIPESRESDSRDGAHVRTNTPTSQLCKGTGQTGHATPAKTFPQQNPRPHNDTSSAQNVGQVHCVAQSTVGQCVAQSTVGQHVALSTVGQRVAQSTVGQRVAQSTVGQNHKHGNVNKNHDIENVSYGEDDDDDVCTVYSSGRMQYPDHDDDDDDEEEFISGRGFGFVWREISDEEDEDDEEAQEDAERRRLEKAQLRAKLAALEISEDPAKAKAADRQGPVEERFHVPLFVMYILVIIYVLLGAVVFYIWDETLEFWDSLYFIYVMLSTTGFGDLLPKPKMYAFIVVYGLVGMALYNILINATLELFMEVLEYLASIGK